ncbi:hypothetical protein [Mycolicibacterium setense]|uniref:hypothetical protein n=1 Tax=Mycolicibacterium setense TaxID=431269 RepID=UPI00104279B0|nr:hypothetical protein [Mycolicibacterium setense]
MTLDAFVSEAGRALGEGRSLYGPAPVGAGFNSATSLDNTRVRVDSAVAESGGQFNGQAGDGYRGQARGSAQALDATSRADQGTGAGVAEGGAQARQGRSGADGVVDDARRGVAAIAPATNTQAGKVEMVNHLQERLMQMRGRLLQSEQRQLALAQVIRAASSGYRPPSGGGGMPMSGGGGAGFSPAGFGGGGGSGPGLSMPRLAGLFNAVNRTTAPGSERNSPIGALRATTGTLRPDSSPHEVAAAIIAQAKKRGYNAHEAIACISTGMQESALSPRAVSPNGLWKNIYQQDSGYPGRDDPNTAIDEFFNRLDKMRASSGASSDIWKNIFWLQQRPGEDSADAAFANGRQAYLSEIRSQIVPATRMYEELTAAA